MHLLDGNDTAWTPWSDGAARAHALLTLEQWRSVREQWPAHLPAGVVVPNDADVAGIAGDLPRWPLVVLQFPKWTDGRAYSQARLLRTRHGYAGDLRAAGEVVADMVPLLLRTGFSSAQLRAGQDRETARRALAFFDGHYQADLTRTQPLFRREAA
jgi:uncharacterized protein (DUF934 family)